MTLTTLSAPDLARGIASGQFSACEVLDAHLGRIAATDTRVNAFTGICHARARTQAQAVDAQRARGEVLPALAGVPYAVKSLFDVQVKRIHEYKRQLLNVLHVVTRYLHIINNPDAVVVPRVVIFAGKAASAYHMAKLIIRLINDVAKVINNDPRVGNKLKVVFIPNYSVSLAEMIIPAADLSEQISTAGTEASGTGNMKLSLNGALTIGTLDGANVEILQNVGADNIFIFGMTTPEVAAVRAAGYQPARIVEQIPELSAVLQAIRTGLFNPEEPERYQAIFDTLVTWGDHYLLLADYASYVEAQAKVDAAYLDPKAWAIMALRNVAGMGPFSSDRTIAEYAEKIWNSPSLQIEG